MQTSARWLALSIVASLTTLLPVLTAHERVVVKRIGAPNVRTIVTKTERWTAGTRYVLDGPVEVAANGTLIIEAGTRVEGRPGTSLVVQRDGRLIAEGTPLQPIVMSCTAAAKSPGCWDGLVVNGFAPINIGTATSPAPRGVGASGCLESSDALGTFGGCDAADSSGVIRYVRVEYATNGASLRGVGSTTIFEFVEVLRAWSDGISIVGGSVNVGRTLVSASGDAGLAWKNGWVGGAQFLIIQQDPANFRSAIRGESNQANPSASPRSAPTIFNATIVAASAPENPNSALPPKAIWLSGGTAGHLRNLIIHRAVVGLDVDGDETCAQLASAALAITNSAFTGVTNLGDVDTDPATCGALTSPDVESQHILTSANANVFLTTPAQIDSVFYDGTSLTLPDLRLRSSGLLWSPNNLATPPSNGFFVPAAYYGAVEPAGSPATQPGTIPWYSGWTIGAAFTAPPLTATISGTVSNSQGPLAGITVSSSGESAVTDANGAFALSVQPGSHTISISTVPSGCAAAAPVNLVVSPGANVIQNFTINCPLPSAHTISAGGLHTCALDGSAWCWGANNHGAVGDGSNKTRSRPVHVSLGTIVLTQITAGAGHSCGLTANGKAYCWGFNEDGQVGDGTFTHRLKPVAVTTALTFVRIEAGGRHTCALTAAGAAYCWGNGQFGQLGRGSSGSRNPHPGLVSNGLTFDDLSAGENHTCALTNSGKAYCWGQNGSGQLGTNSFGNRSVPTAVTGDFVFSNVSAGDNHTCAVTSTGEARCWGLNANGQLGNGTTAPSLAPSLVAGSNTFHRISAGGRHTCAITATGSPFCWGLNSSGQLGIGSFGQRTSPTAVNGGLTFREIDAGGAHTCGVVVSGAASCWGSNEWKQVGNGSSSDAKSPVPVALGSTGGA